MKAVRVNHKALNQSRGSRMKGTWVTKVTGVGSVELEIGTTRRAAEIRWKLRDAWVTKSNLEPSACRVC